MVIGGAEKLSPKLRALVADDDSDLAGPPVACPCTTTTQDELPAAADDAALEPASFATPPLQVGGRRQRAQPAPTGGSRKRGRSDPHPEPAPAVEVKAVTRRRGTPALALAAAASSAAPTGSAEPSFRVPSGASGAALQAAVAAAIAFYPGWGGSSTSGAPAPALHPVVTIGAPVPTHGQYAGHCAFVSLLRSYGEGGGGGGGASSVPEELAAVMQLRRGELMRWTMGGKGLAHDPVSRAQLPS